jgi:hypothetical protein
MAKITNKQAWMHINSRAPFTNSTGSFRGTEQFASHGILPEGWRAVLDRDMEAGEVVFYVYSYHTPIAWYLSTGKWVVPPVKYSSTTSRHQTEARRGANW